MYRAHTYLGLCMSLLAQIFFAAPLVPRPVKELRVAAVGNTSLSVKWEPASDGYSGEQFLVFHRPTGGTWTNDTKLTNETSANITGLLKDTEYEVGVQAVGLELNNTSEVVIVATGTGNALAGSSEVAQATPMWLIVVILLLVLLLIILVIVLVCCCLRRRNKPTEYLPVEPKKKSYHYTRQRLMSSDQ